ncbi:MAG TPA: alkyl sulfatase dimerization domain-containing protein [Polyangiaceae bacterium]|nr:alkyl sulfatase dimerization domain-containing protein [Polyangiaceae bacterium]
MRRSLSVSILCASLATLHCSRQRAADGDESSTRHPLVATAAAAEQPSLAPKDATDATMKANAAYLSMLPFSDRQDFDDAQRGFVAKPTSSVVKDKSGRVVWSLEDYAFEQAAEAPPTVKPSLWRQAQLNRISGLFKVADRVYQVRGFDISNTDVIEGNTGIIIVDPLISTETAKAALDLYYANRPKKPVVAVIYTHSHGDHYGGALGVVSRVDVAAKKTQILAPEGFLEHAVSENVYAGNAMNRRGEYQYGVTLPRGPKGAVDIGLGKATSTGTISLIPPTDVIVKAHDKRTIDGVELEFQLTPGTEAPAEMNIYFPQFRVLCVAENATHTLHNLLTLRGALVRDAKVWSSYLDEALVRYGGRSDVVMAQHHWPTFGQPRVSRFLADQRDLYRYIHDQSLRLLNQGYTPMEIAEKIQLPKSLATRWYNRDYYGSMSHDSRAVYQRYLGFYDGNPSDLNPLPPEEGARKYVEYMGGEKAVLDRAQKDFAAGNYRWVAEVLKHAVFADPANTAAKALLADALEQLGYQAENGTWRSVYLKGALELRQGVPKQGGISTSGVETLSALTMPMNFDYMALRLDPQKVEGKRLSLNWVFPDLKKKYGLYLSNSTLNYREGAELPNPDATITLSKSTWDAIAEKKTTLPGEIDAGRVQIAGNRTKVTDLFAMLDDFDPRFDIVTP